MEATPSKPLGALVVVQSPIVAAWEPPLPGDASLFPEPVLAEVSFAEPLLSVEGVLSVEEVSEVDDPVADCPGCWHCQEGSGAQESPIC